MIKNKRKQKQKSKILEVIPKKAQEEIVGFSMIVVIVAIILVIFLSFSIKSPQKVTGESYEVHSFLQALMQKTSDCRDINNLGYLSVKDLVFRCYSNETCLDGKETCDILLEEIGKVSNESWNFGEESMVKGYLLNISAEGTPLEVIGYGNQTRNLKGAVQKLTRGGNMFNLNFIVYY